MREADEQEMRQRGRQEYAFRPHGAHQRRPDDRSDHGAEPVEAASSPPDTFDEILRFGVVVGMRDRQRIERVGRRRRRQAVMVMTKAPERGVKRKISTPTIAEASEAPTST